MRAAVQHVVILGSVAAVNFKQGDAQGADHDTDRAQLTAGASRALPTPVQPHILKNDVWRPEVHAGYSCELRDKDNATAWLGYDWDLLSTIHFAGGFSVWTDGSYNFTARTAAIRCEGSRGCSCDPTSPDGAEQAAFIRHAAASNTKVVLQVVNKQQPDEILPFLRDSSARALAGRNVLQYASRAGFAGLSMDLERIPRFNATFKGLLATWLGELISQAAPLNLTVASTVAFDIGADRGVDVPALGREVTGGLVLMAYDYHWGCGDAHAGPNTPMIGNHGTCGDKACNVNHSVAVALDTMGVPAHNLLLGIAWYGREYPTNSSMYEGFTACNSSAKDQMDKAYQAPLAAARAAKYGRRWDASTLTPWYEFKDPQRPWLWWQGYYEDSESVVFKYSLVKHRKLKGVLIWMLNGCTQNEAPRMWAALRETLFAPDPAAY